MVRECRPLSVVARLGPGSVRRSTTTTSIPASANSAANIIPVGAPAGDHHRVLGHPSPRPGIRSVARCVRAAPINPSMNNNASTRASRLAVRAKPGFSSRRAL